MSDARNQFTAGEIVDLLSELDKRLKKRGISASVGRVPARCPGSCLRAAWTTVM
jgi:hypothetical protein